MVLFFHSWSHLKKLGALALVAALLSFLSFVILHRQQNLWVEASGSGRRPNV